MTQYIVSTRELSEESGPVNEPPSTAGWTYAVKPVWIHDLLDLWERNKLLTQYLELATDRMAQDIQNPNTRRRTLSQIARTFVPQTGRGRRSRTVSPNPWAAYSQLYRAQLLAPAYLVHIVGHNDMARAAATLLHKSVRPGEQIVLSDVRDHLVERFGDRRSVRDSAGAILRTFAHFGVLAQYGRSGEYRFASRLPRRRGDVPALDVGVVARIRRSRHRAATPGGRPAAHVRRPRILCGALDEVRRFAVDAGDA